MNKISRRQFIQHSVKGTALLVPAASGLLLQVDCAAWKNPHRYPKGMEYGIVNGQVVIREGEHTGKLPGRILKRTHV